MFAGSHCRTRHFPLAGLMSFDFQLQEVAQSRHVDESQLPDLLHVDLGEVLNVGHPEATLGANEAL